MKSSDLLKFIKQVTYISNLYEQTNTELKKEYIKKNIDVFNEIASKVPGNHGSFGTGYPFYALGDNYKGELPIITEQFNYNVDLLNHAKKSKRTIWGCRGCLTSNYDTMLDLKQVCKPCPKMDDGLKPRKVINRLPDIDMWLVCADGHVQDAEQILSRLFLQYGLHTSDVDPIQTIQDVKNIVENLKNGRMPSVFLPLDAHIIEYSKLKKMIHQVPETIDNSIKNSEIPYLPIHPRSYRKTWQYDDMAYNFVHDFLLSFTGFNFNHSLEEELMASRKQITEKYNDEELWQILFQVLGEATKRRFYSTPELYELFIKKMNIWRDIKLEDKTFNEMRIDE